MSNGESGSAEQKDLKREEEAGCRGREKNLRHSTELLQIGKDTCPSSLLLQKKSQKGSLETFRPQPSAVLSSVKSFLPQLSAANARLSTLPPGQLDIQNVEDCIGPVIEMDLALIPTVYSSSSESESSEEEEDEDAEEQDCTDQSEKGVKDAGLGGEVTEHNLRLSQDSGARKRPKIEELEGGGQPKR